MRYFKPSHAEEYEVPVRKLRQGGGGGGAGGGGKEGGTNAEDWRIEKLDFKGRYGVSIIYNDGHFAEIRSFEDLKKLAQESKN